MRWISVEDELPPGGVKCLVYGDKNELFSTGELVISEGHFDYRIGWRSGVSAVHYWASYPNVPALVEQDAQVDG